MSLIDHCILFLVAILWGATNPFIAKGSAGVEKVEGRGVRKKLSEIAFLFTNWSYTIPFALNQLGSVLFFIHLQKVELSLAVPVTNALAFVFTAATSYVLGEQVPSLCQNVGIAMIIGGTTICMLEKERIGL